MAKRLNASLLCWNSATISMVIAIGIPLLATACIAASTRLGVGSWEEVPDLTAEVAEEFVTFDDETDRVKNSSSSNKAFDYRQPVDLALSDDERFLAVANQKTGDLYVWEIASKKLIQQLPLCKSLTDLQSMSKGRLVALSQEEGRMFFLKWGPEGIGLQQIITTSSAPVRAEWIASQSLLRVACLWSRRVDTFRVGEADDDIQKVAEWDLPFAPRYTQSLPDRSLTVVADAFGSQIAVIDDQSGKARASHQFLGHSICGLRLSAEDEIAFAHATVNDYAETTENDIHWGVLLSNDLRWVKLDRLISETKEEVYRQGAVHPVGIPSNGAAEPTSMTLTKEGFYVVTAGGTDQVAIGTRERPNFRYVNVGRYPVSSVVAESTQIAFVANKFEDSVSVVDLRRAKLVDTLFMGGIRGLTAAEKGERLFHDASLSHDRWLTCASCHVDGHTNGLLTDNLSDRSYGAAKRVTTLLGNGSTTPYGWLGLDPSLHSQIVRSVEKTMQSYRKLDAEEVGFIASYCESLVAPPSVGESRKTQDLELIERGRVLFAKQNCIDCHLPPTYTTPETYDVGIRDEKGAKSFNPPSLKGLSQRGPQYFHDNRAEGIRGVLVDHKHKLEQPLSDEDRQALIAFLESL